MPVFAPRTLRHWARIVPTETLPRSNFPTCRRETYAQTHTQKPSFKGKIKQGNRHWATPCTRPSIVFRGRFEWFGNIVQPWFVCVLRALLFFFPLLVLLLSDGTGKEGWPHNIFLLLIFFLCKEPQKIKANASGSCGRPGSRAISPSVRWNRTGESRCSGRTTDERSPGPRRRSGPGPRAPRKRQVGQNSTWIPFRTEPSFGSAWFF